MLAQSRRRRLSSVIGNASLVPAPAAGAHFEGRDTISVTVPAVGPVAAFGRV